MTGEASVSRELTAAAAKQLRSAHPNAHYVYRDLVKDTLRHYTAVARLHAATPDLHTAEQKEELQVGKDILEEFLAADVVIVGAPMYNFGIPSQLKAWVDHICVAGSTFKYTAKGPEGACGNKKIIVVSSRGGLYGPGSPYEPFDHQQQYLKHLFTFLGVTDLTIITAEGAAYGPEKRTEAIEAAKGKIAQLK